jgi:GPH family glycoside/pentoside/hexuronide:cation symporter
MDKGPAYAIGMGMGAVALLVLWFLPAKPTVLIYPIMVLAGFGFGANWIFPWAMIADVADYDRVKSGKFRSGVYYGVWGLATKISEALALAAVGWVLTGFGYVPNIAQTPHALLGIRLFFSIVPAVGIFVGLPLLFKYPLTRKSHAEIKAKLLAMDAAAKNDA